MPFNHPRGPSPRTAAILEALKSQRSLKDIAAEFGISYQRVQQIAYYWNVKRPPATKSSDSPGKMNFPGT